MNRRQVVEIKTICSTYGKMLKNILERARVDPEDPLARSIEFADQRHAQFTVHAFTNPHEYIFTEKTRNSVDKQLIEGIQAVIVARFKASFGSLLGQIRRLESQGEFCKIEIDISYPAVVAAGTSSSADTQHKPWDANLNHNDKSFLKSLRIGAD